MLRLKDLTTGAVLRGIRPNENVTVETVKWHGSDVVEVTYKEADHIPLPGHGRHP